MSEEHQGVAKEELIGIDKINDHMLSSQIPVSQFTGPLIGWALLALLVLDMVGNLLGIPVLTGWLLGGEQKVSPFAVVFAFVVQVGVLWAALVSLYKSPWRFWFLAMSGAGTGEDGGGSSGVPDFKSKFSSLMGRLSEQKRKLQEATKRATEGPPSEADQRRAKRRQGMKVLYTTLLLLAIAAGLVLLFFVRQAAIMLLAISAAVFFLKDSVFALAKPIVPKIRSDYASLLGVLLGTALAAVSSLLLNGQSGLFLRYPVKVWYRGDLFEFRLLQLFLLSGAVIALGLLFKTSLRYATFFRATAPAGGPDRAYYTFNYAALSTWPVHVRLDPDSLPKVVVLGQRQDKTYELVDHSERLPLISRAFTILNLQMLQKTIGESRTRISDQGDFFSCEARYIVLPRSLDALRGTLMEKLGNVLPDRAVGSLLNDLFKSENPRGLLDKLLSETLTEYVSESQVTARDLYENYINVRNQARQAASLSQDQMRIPMELASGDAAGLQLFIVGFEQLRAARSTLQSLLDGPRGHWQEFRQKRLKAKETVERLFQKNLRDHFMKQLAEEGSSKEDTEAMGAIVDCLLECANIRLMIDRFDFAPGPAMECEMMMETLEEEDKARQAEIDAELRQREAKLSDFFQTRVLNIEQGKRNVVNQLIDTAPRVLPFLLQHPEGGKFVKMLMNMGEKALANKLEQMKQIEGSDAQLAAKIEEIIGSPDTLVVKPNADDVF